MVRLAWTAVLLLLVAGCATPAEPVVEEIPDLGLQATSTTGVIRGVVVDEAIRPIANVTITLTGTATRNTTSNDAGFFGFDGLQPGTYFLSASKPGHAGTQSSVSVVANDPEPPVVKLQLLIDATTRPYAELSKWEGYLECGLSVIALCGAAEGISNDNFNAVVTISAPPQLVQSEAVWQTTTAASDELWLWHSSASKPEGGFNGTRNSYAWRQGPSPLLMTSNATESEDSEFGVNNDLYLRMFTGSISGTRNPTDPDGCYPGGPVGDVYCGGIGYSIAQSFTVYTTVYYGFLPPEGWTFVDTGQVPEPPT